MIISKLENDSKKKICLLDTNAISNASKDNFNKLNNQFSVDEYIYAITPLTWRELSRSNPLILNKIYQLMLIQPMVILKNFYEILSEEYNHIDDLTYYPDILSICPVCHIIKGQISVDDMILQLKRTEFAYGSKVEDSINDNFETLKEYAQFVKDKSCSKDSFLQYRLLECVFLQQVRDTLPRSCYSVVGKNNNDFLYYYFYSECAKIYEYSWYYKMCSGNRKIQKNDVVDLMNCAYLPFCSVYITENNQIAELRKCPKGLMIHINLTPVNKIT